MTHAPLLAFVLWTLFLVTAPMLPKAWPPTYLNRKIERPSVRRVDWYADWVK